MEPERREEAFDDPAYLFQVKWDGVRVLAHIDRKESGIRLFNRRLHERTRQYPEIVDVLRRLLIPDRVILDGEVVALSEGRPSFQKVLKRDWATADLSIRAGVLETPVVYVVFDLVLTDGRDLTSKRLDERQEALKEVLAGGEAVSAIDSFDSGMALFEGVRARGLEGIVAKKRSSPYLIGEKTPYWLKIKVLQRKLCVVGGFLPGQGGTGSLLLGAHDDGKLRYIGRAGSGLSSDDVRVLRSFAAANAPVPSPFSVTPDLGRNQAVWVVPQITVWVEFLEWTEEGLMRHPKVVGFSKEPPAAAVL